MAHIARTTGCKQTPTLLADVAVLSTDEDVPSSAASQGVFMTMMAASRQKAAPPALADATAMVPVTQTFCRHQEEALLDRIFSNSCASASAPPVALTMPTSQRLIEALNQVKAVSMSDSLWTCAARCDPPECRLPERVLKRKAETEVHKQMVRRQALEQRVASDAAVPSSKAHAHQSQKYDVGVHATQSSSTIINHFDNLADCIVLTSPVSAVHADRTKPTCAVSQRVECAVAHNSPAQTMDPIKRMRLQALQQELEAAKATVANLERMIKAEELS